MSSSENKEVEEQRAVEETTTETEAPKESISKSQSPETDAESRSDSGSARPSEAPESRSTSEVPPTTQWQAVWSPQYNAYYFYNPTTQETTWVNPLQPEASTSATPSTSTAEASSSSSTPEAAGSGAAGPSSSSGYQQPTLSAQAQHKAALEAAAIAQGIDPALAHLDPSLLTAAIPGASASADPSMGPVFTAKFNARTGQFAPAASRDPTHLSEYERAKRMSEFYFDVNKWEEDLAKRGGRLRGEEDGEGSANGDGSDKKRKRPTKKDIERFKEQKRQKKIAKTAWLRT
ncbi:hypothetical protein D9613_010888 [Agrocybe pediades]|uniref:WW domain-containing protein n=1 Tax=Agrocybe pediades TaxID=84607 RepID=A0A8H4QLN9_9AGAR|nr:hypothetical protein D9613_010888 [Agrocybe pediades]KAF9558656.1 hypothetical protein CPC08DRAFT_691891 [Agrocybe pediades]